MVIDIDVTLRGLLRHCATPDSIIWYTNLKGYLCTGAVLPNTVSASDVEELHTVILLLTS